MSEDVIVDSRLLDMREWQAHWYRWSLDDVISTITSCAQLAQDPASTHTPLSRLEAAAEHSIKVKKELYARMYLTRHLDDFQLRRKMDPFTICTPEQVEEAMEMHL